jgi:tRNA A-37 threonylcarbamoyl transferase component Bud32
MLEAGQRVGRYRIVRFLGAGAMGEVYLADDPHIERRLAIKTVRLEGGRPQDIEDRKKRLLREARAAGRLLHPNVVTLFDTGEEGGLLFLAFEFVEGCDLASRLETGEPPTLREVLGITRQVAEALDYAHRQGIVHRDIKPSNILIDTGGHVKVADFGIAKVAGQNTELTIAGSVMGSPQYLSPEQIRGDELDGRSDVFSLGVVLYEMLSGRRPFDGETITTLVYQILHKDPSISELRSVPLRLEQLLHHMLAKDREDRLATAGLVAEELAAIERNLPEATLAAPAAPADAELDVTRVLSSRSLAAAPLAGGAASAAAQGASHAPGSAVAPGAAPAATTAPAPSAPPAPPTAVSYMPAGNMGPGARAAAAAAPLPAPTPPAGAPGPYTQAPAVPAPPPAGRSSSARIWLALAVLLLLFCGVVGPAAFWFWQRYGRRAGQEISRLSQYSSAQAGSSTASAPSASTLPSASASASASSGSSPAAGLPPATVRATPTAPGPSAGAPPSAAPAPPAPPPATRQVRPPVGSAGASGTAARGSTAADNAGGPAPVRGRSNVPVSKSETASSAPAAARREAPAAASPDETTAGAAGGGAGAAGSSSRNGGRVERSPRAEARLADAGTGQPAGQDRDRDPAASGSDSAAAAAAPSADRVIHSGLELAFRVNPPDAFVLLDGAVIGKAQEWSGQKGGRSFTLPGTGSHLVKIKRQGMKDYRITVEASEARGITPVMVNLQPLPAAQIETSDLQTVRVREAIALRVQPDVNAVVLVDGTAAGPVKKFAGRFGHGDEWLILPPGTHRVTLVAPGYGRRDLAVEITPGAEKERQKIDIQLSPAAGSQ